MKYIHKTSLGLEHYFANVSPVISLLGEYSAEEAMEQLMERSVREQNDICKGLFHALQQLLSSDFLHKELVPDNVQRIADSLIVPDAYSIERVLPILLWMEKIHLKNEQDKVRWLTNLHGLAGLTDTMTAAFIENFPLVDSQRVTVLREGDCVRVNLPEKLWGRISLVLPQAQAALDLDSPVFGYLFVLEADTEEDRCELRLLLDLEFSETPYQQRLLSAENWLEINLTCDIPRLELALYDYTGRTSRYGWGHTRILSACCEALQSKYTVLGRSGLGEIEGRLLILAQLFGCAAAMGRKFPSEDFDWNVSLLENRFGLENTIKLLRSQGYTGQELATPLRAAYEAFEIGDLEKTMRHLMDFSRTYVSLEESLWGCRFARRLVTLFSKASGVYTDTYVEQAPQKVVLNTLDEQLGETIKNLGFTGELPHYTRIYGRSVHYLSFVMSREPFITERGEMKIPYSLSIARIRAKAAESQDTKKSEGPSDFCAEDFAHIHFMTKFGRLATEEDDGQAGFTVDFKNPEQSIPGVEDLARQLEYHVLIADNALKDQPLDKAYLATLRQIFRRRKTLLRTAIPILLCSLASAAALGYWMVDTVFHVNYTKLSVLGFVAAAVVVALAATLILYWKRIRSIWMT